MTLYHLDTNTFSDLVRRPGGPVRDNISARRDDVIGMSLIVRCEIEFGLAQKASGALRKRVELVLQTMPVFDFTAPVQEQYGWLRAELKRLGTPIGPNDLFIAAHALMMGAVLVTDNETEFSRVPGLSVENWLR
jgi:tRNA(fMet)-specific endonuclease VapC